MHECCEQRIKYRRNKVIACLVGYGLTQSTAVGDGKVLTSIVNSFTCIDSSDVLTNEMRRCVQLLKLSNRQCGSSRFESVSRNFFRKFLE